MPSFGNYYNEYTDNPSPVGAERFQVRRTIRDDLSSIIFSQFSKNYHQQHRLNTIKESFHQHPEHQAGRNISGFSS